MTTQTPLNEPLVHFTPDVQRALRLLRARYLLDRDLISPRERARLGFLRWLYRTGRLTP